MVDLVSEGSGIDVSSSLHAPDPTPLAPMPEQVVQAEVHGEDAPAGGPLVETRAAQVFRMDTPTPTAGPASAPTTAAPTPRSVVVATGAFDPVEGQVVDTESVQ